MSATPVLAPADAYALWAASYPPTAHNPLMQAEERAMLSLLPDTLWDCAVLDAGCGSGRYLRQARSRKARHLLGVDLSEEMLLRARAEWKADTSAPRPPDPPMLGENEARNNADSSPQIWGVGGAQNSRNCLLLRTSLAALPLRDAWADVTLCGLTLGHLESLDAPLAELHRVTRPGGLLLCSDFHPACHALGWQRTFTAEGKRYAVRHTVHLYSDWHRACRRLNLQIEHVLEPFLEPSDLPNSPPDPRALEVPVALVLALRRRA